MILKLRKNREIKSEEVRLVDKNGEMVGVVSLDTALKMAFEANLDLVEISPKANPPVCKIVSFSKLKYEEEKKANKTKKKQKTVDIKEINISFNISDGDFDTKVKQAVKFISRGDEVKFNFRFKGREITFVDSVQELVNKILDTVKDIAVIKEKPKLEGKVLYFIIKPTKI